MAEKRTVVPVCLNFRSWPKALLAEARIMLAVAGT
jgi:hypothetical protein